MADPAECLETAEAVLEEAAAGAFADRQWLFDQHNAAGKEMRPMMEVVGKHLGGEIMEEEPSPRIVAVALAVSESITRRVNQGCEHSHSETPPPLMVDLGPGFMTCQECAMNYVVVAALAIDDGRCDLCDRETEYFHEFWVQLGPALVHGDICEECRKWV